MNDNDYDNVMWVGGINADFVRNTVFTNTIDRFVSEMSLEKSWDKYKIDFTHSFDREEQTYVSTLDHFFGVKEYQIISRKLMFFIFPTIPLITVLSTA